MNQILKALLVAITNSFIVMTLILSPIPFSEINLAKAQDSKDCEENKNADGSAGVYKAGCEFNKDLSKTDAKKHYPKGVAGIIEQFVGVAFAMIGVKLFWKPNVHSLKSCKELTTTGGAKTFPIVQAGTLAYLLGELKANSEFSKASKIAVDKNFQAKQMDDEANNKQIASYDALIEVYDKQAKGLKFKKNMALLAEVAFLSATAMEYFDNKKLNMYCETQVESLTNNYQAIMKSLDAGVQATNPCTNLTTAITNFTTLLSKQDEAIKITFATNAKNKEKAAGKAEKGTFDFITSIPKKIYSSLFDKPDPEDTAEQQQTMFAEVQMNEENNTLYKTQREAFIQQIPIALQADIAIHQATVPVGTAQIATCKTLGSQMQGLVNTIETLKKTPINCCGNYAALPSTVTLDVIPPTFEAPTLPVPTFEEPAMPQINTDDQLAQLNKELEEKNAQRAQEFQNQQDQRMNHINERRIEQMQEIQDRHLARMQDLQNRTQPSGSHIRFLKPAIENLIYRVVYEKMYKDHKDPANQLDNLAQIGHYTDYILMNGQQTWEESNLKKELAEYKRKYQNDPKSYEQKLGTIVSQLKDQLTIAAANAEVWKDLLGLGVKAFILHMVMWDWMEAHALNYPKARMYTWGTMAAVNLAVYMFDGKSEKEAKKRAETVRLEKERFMESHGILAGVEEGSSDKSASGDGSLSGSGNQGVLDTGGSGSETTMTCAVPNGNGFLPAQCPAPGPNTGLRMPTVTVDENGKRITGTLNSGLQAIGNATQAMGSSADPENDKAFQASIRTLSDVAPALRRLNQQIVDEADAKDKIASRASGTKPFSLKRALANTRSLFSGGGAGSTPITTAALNRGADALQDTAKKMEKEQAKKFNFKPLAMPSFDTNLGSMGGGGSSFSDSAMEATRSDMMSNLDIEQETISQDKSGNIFKMITNRYLLNYPVLLNEKKKKKK